jgi:hypothetical protein
MTQHKTHIALKNIYIPFIVLSTVIACSEDVPKKEDVPELITKATLTFTPAGEGDAVVVTATDPDADGVQPIEIDGAINLSADQTYTLTIKLNNTIVAPSDPAYDITAEVTEEGDEHMFFFGWTGNVFINPSGDGNIDHRADAVNYSGGSDSIDKNGLPLGLTTTWTTSSTAGEGTFNVVLKHQPELKTETSGSDIGETDLMLAFPISISE